MPRRGPTEPKSRKDDAYVPKTVDLDDIDVTLPDGTTEIVHLAAHGGWLSVKEINEVGEPSYEHLVCHRIQRNADKRGFRFYGYLRLPDHRGRTPAVRPVADRCTRPVGLFTQDLAEAALTLWCRAIAATGILGARSPYGPPVRRRVPGRRVS